MLAAQNLTIKYGSNPVLKDFSIDVARQEVIALIGPNGSGKSTALKALAGLIKPNSGRVVLDEKALDKWPRRALARKLSLLPQSPITPDGLSVRQLLRQGRFAHLGLFRGFRTEDQEAISWALKHTNLEQFSDRGLAELSGGERQRAWIAAALAQEAEILLLDEPTSYLDIGHQIEVLGLIHRLSRQREKTIILSIHDLNHAMTIADRILLLDQGNLVFDGLPNDLAASGKIESVFKIKGQFITNGPSNTPHLEVQILV